MAEKILIMVDKDDLLASELKFELAGNRIDVVIK